MMRPNIQQLQLKWFQIQPLTMVPPFILFLIFLYKWLYKNKSISGIKLLPCPPKLPIIGNLHQLSNYPHRSLRSLSDKYGDLMVIHLCQSPALIVSSAKAAREIMKTNDVIFSNRPTTKTTNKLLYNGKDVATAQYGEYWRQMKSICVLQLFSNKRVRSFRGVREEEMNLLVRKIQESASSSSSSESVNLSEMFSTLANDVICRVAFRRKYNEEEAGGGTGFKRLVKEFLETLGCFRVGEFIPWLGWTDRVDGWTAKVDKLAKELDQFLEEVVKQHQEDRLISRGHTSKDELEEKDFVDVLLNLQKDDDESAGGFPIERDGIKALILDMFSGGTDTSYTVLEWAMTELLRHPTIMQQVQKEVRGLSGGKSSVNEDEMEQMKYLKAVIKETLRLHPPIPLLTRLSAQDIKVSGFDIPAGMIVMTNIWAIQRDPAYWEEPDKFNPDRFLTCSVDFKGQDFQFLPFGTGRRICPGILFAMAEIELVLANLLLKFDWTLPRGLNVETLDMSESTGVVTHRKTPLLAVATSSPSFM